jgi:hypothetical protein
VNAIASQSESGIWTVKLTTLRDGTVGERTLEADSCTSLADATALIVALTIDPAQVAAFAPGKGAAASQSAPSPVAAEDEPSVTAVPQTQARPVPPPRVILTPKDSPPAPNGPHGPRVQIAILPAIGGDLGTLPKTAYGVSLGGSLLLGRFRGELYAAYWPSQTASGALGASEGTLGSFELVDGGFRACFAAVLGTIELYPCAGMEAGALHGGGVNLVPSLTQTGLWLAVTLDARLVYRLTRSWGIALDAGTAVPLRRDHFTAGTSSSAPTIHEAGLFEGRASLGPELRF